MDTYTLTDLIRKYSASGPRYTSYPPAPLLSHIYTAEDYAEDIQLQERNLSNADFSLYVHIPFCDSLCYFCGCTTIITRNRSAITRYVDLLKKEIDFLAARLNGKRKIIQMHWGGGTPTYLSPAEITDLGLYIRNSFVIDPDAELSVEVDPRELTRQHLRALSLAGFNRMSLGVQDFHPKVQQAVNRVQSEFITRQAVRWGRELGFTSLNIDLIYGLPLQTVDTFSETLKKIIDIDPDRIAVYNFAHVPWLKKHQRLLHPEDLPSLETKLDLLTMTINKLEGAGYIYIGMDHFARPSDELTIARDNRTLQRNFQGYSTRGGSDLFGIGLSAISHFGGSYAQNAKDLDSYSNAVREGKFATSSGYRMTLDDQIRKHVIMRIMCDLVLDVREVEVRFGIIFSEYFNGELLALYTLEKDGLVTMNGSELRVTSEGRLFLRNIAMCFDAYLKEDSKGSPQYSRTV